MKMYRNLVNSQYLTLELGIEVSLLSFTFNLYKFNFVSTYSESSLLTLVEICSRFNYGRHRCNI